MTIREKKEELEKNILSEFATLSANTKGRKKYEEKCEIRTEFQRDRDRIIHSRAFRRLKHKTQVFILPYGDHYRTRLTHTLEVTQIAKTIASALRLNEDLVEAIALGHDLGHTPFGHIGEEILDNICKDYNLRFFHNEQSLRIVEYLEKDGQGLNLTYEVKDGILNHTKGRRDLEDLDRFPAPSTLEGKVVQIADRIAYLNHDIADAIRAGLVTPDELPSDCIKILGSTQSERISTMVKEVINNSINKNYIKMSREVEKLTDKLKEFLFEKVYFNKKVIEENYKVELILRSLFNYYMNNEEELLNIKKCDKIEKVRRVCDYISGMSDTYALNKFKEKFLPHGW